MISWRGIFPVLATPFHDDLSLDLDSLRREVEFCIERGAAGLVAPVVIGEFFTLSDRERIDVFRTCVQAAQGVRPVVAGISGTSGPHAAELARAAEEVGADAVIAMPPYAQTVGPVGILAYFSAIARATRLPICLQNAPPPLGSPLSAEGIERLMGEVRSVRVIKEETLPNTHQIGAVVGRLGKRVEGVFGGAGGAYLLDELRRGASGCMPAPEFMELHVVAYDRFVSDDAAGADEVFRALLPGVNYERLLQVPFVKELLHRRGVLSSTATRAPGVALDSHDRFEIDRLWPTWEPFLH
jgi:4-hydroxy-tetrahydrodipicolinate synthase